MSQLTKCVLVMPLLVLYYLTSLLYSVYTTTLLILFDILIMVPIDYSLL